MNSFIEVFGNLWELLKNNPGMGIKILAIGAGIIILRKLIKSDKVKKIVKKCGEGIGTMPSSADGWNGSGATNSSGETRTGAGMLRSSSNSSAATVITRIGVISATCIKDRIER